MLRLTGAVCLLVSGLLIGLQMRHAAQKKLRLISSVISLVRYARRKIALFGTPTAELFLDFTGDIDPDAERALCRKSAEEAMEQIACMLREDGDILRKFMRDVGSGYKADALSVCDYCIETMQDRLKSAEATYAAQKKLYVALPVLFVISIMVLIL